MSDEPIYLTPSQAALLLQVSEKTLTRWARDFPTFPVTKIGDGRNATVRYHRERLERWLAMREQGSRFQKQTLGARNSASSRTEAAS